MIAPAPRPCPVCAGMGRDRLHRQEFAGGFLGGSYDVVVCHRCGAGFADGIPTQAELDAYYKEQSKYTYSHADGMESPYDFARFRRIVDQVVSFVPSKKAAILDVGCATGGLLACFKERGFLDVMGIDPSPECAAVARRVHGVPVVSGTVAALSTLSRRFDVILFVGVLEHLREVKSAVRAAVRLLAPGGLFYCAQPDVDAFANCRNAPFQQFSGEHVNFFSERSLHWLLTDCELSPKQTWQWIVEWREGVTDSVVSGIYERISSRPVAPVADSETAAALTRYVEASERQARAIEPIIAALAARGEPVIVWGVGAHTQWLLATSKLKEANIAAFTDSSKKHHGAIVAGRKVVAPSALPRDSTPILVSSQTFQSEIVETIRKEFGCDRPIITLY